MKRLILFLTGMSLIMTACVGLSTVTPAEVTEEALGITDPGKPIEVRAGDEFNIVVQSNSSTGYHWELIGELDADVVELVSKDYQADEPVMPGSGGLDIWIFKAVAPGETTITLGYYPPSNETVEPAQTETFAITVK